MAAVFVFVLVTGAGAVVGFFVVRTAGWWVEMRLSQMSDTAEYEFAPDPHGDSDRSGRKNDDVTPLGEVLVGRVPAREVSAGAPTGGPMVESSISSGVDTSTLAASMKVEATAKVSNESSGEAPEVADVAMAQTAFESSVMAASASTAPAPSAKGEGSEAMLPVTSVEEGARDAAAMQPSRLRRRRRLNA